MMKIEMYKSIKVRVVAACEPQKWYANKIGREFTGLYLGENLGVLVVLAHGLKTTFAHDPTGFLLISPVDFVMEEY